MRTTIADVIKLVRDVFEVKRKNVTMSDRQTDLKAQLEGILAAGHTISGQITAG